MRLSSFELTRGVDGLQADRLGTSVSAPDLSHVPGAGIMSSIQARAPAMKARALLAERGVIALAREVLDVDEFAEWSEHAVGIQTAIYRLDHHYEVSKAIEWREEAPLWRDVQVRLAQVPGDSSDMWAAFKNLRDYADAERRIHCFDPIDLREFEGILQQKCADVRIARSLVWTFGHRSVSRLEIAFWNIYDQCWEIIEDLVDIKEDGQDWNFNFWLYAPMAHLRTRIKIESVQDLLGRRLSDLEHVKRRLPVCAFAKCQPAFEATLQAVVAMGDPVGHVFSAIASGRVLRFGDDSALEERVQLRSSAEAVLRYTGGLALQLR
jgi:hypothetical protein